jgi:hypothetical protein
VARRPELGDDLTAVRDEDGLTTSNVADVFAQAILELAQADGFHSDNVASRSYIVNRRLVSLVTLAF